jgi:hypothetical protein
MKPPVIVIPLSKSPVYESAGLFLGTLAFPIDEKKRYDFARAWCKETIRLSAGADPQFAWTPQLLMPGYFIMSDDKTDKIIKEGEIQLENRKNAYLATNAYFAEALLQKKIDRIVIDGTREPLTIENCFRFVNLFRDKPAGASVKNPRRDYLYPSKGVIHAAHALYSGVSLLCEENIAKSEAEAFSLMFSNINSLTYLLRGVEHRRVSAIQHDRLMKYLKASEADLIQFIAG